VDRQHGTERSVAEQLERFAAQAGLEVHLYSQAVRDLDCVLPYSAVVSPSHILWHKISRLPGPHLFSYLWWFVANHGQRRWDSVIRGLKFDVIYSPGVNALDADVISIHIIFNELRSRVHRLNFRAAPLSLWPVILHRQLYYGLICLLERVVYKHRRNTLIAVSQHTAASVAQLFHRRDVTLIRHGVDTNGFNPRARTERRERARSSFGVQASDICLLLIGNDWKTKGLGALLKAMAECGELPLVLLIVGSDDRRAYAEPIRAFQLDGKLRFLRPSRDVLQFYAAADIYVGASLEDSYGLPIIEAMACGLPVIASARAGVSEIITNRIDGVILNDPENHRELADLLRWLSSEAAVREQIGREASVTAQRYPWDANAAQTWNLLKEAAERKKSARMSKAPAR
jgi:glycosyltransferase involved in cell wall biosynthesis